MYQKRYLLLLLGGFQECEQTTLAMISRMGAYPTNTEQTSRFPRGFSRFRMAVRAVIAIKRMRFLVNKSKRVSKRVSGVDDRKSSKQTRSADGVTSSPDLLRANQTMYEPVRVRRTEPLVTESTPTGTRREPVGGHYTGPPSPLVDEQQHIGTGQYFGSHLTNGVAGASLLPSTHHHGDYRLPQASSSSQGRYGGNKVDRRSRHTNGEIGDQQSTRPSITTSDRLGSLYGTRDLESQRDLTSKRTEPLTSASMTSERTIPYTSRSPRALSPSRTERHQSPSTLRTSPKSYDRYRPPMSPPVRDSESDERDHDGFISHGRSADVLPRHSSPRGTRQLPRHDEDLPRTSSPGSSSLNGSSPRENGDHSLSMYIQRLESLQNRLASANKG